MKNIEMTTMSSKGQVVIPTAIRDEMGLINGSKLMIVTDGNNLLLKPVETPRLAEFQSLIRRSRKWAKETGIKKKDLPRMLKKVRRESRP